MKRAFAVAALLALTFAAAPAGAGLITKTLTVDVYVLCDDGGNNCASTGPTGNAYFAAETNKIWAQAGIGVNFRLASYINSSPFSYLDDGVTGDSFVDLAYSYGTHGPSTTSVDMFLVHTVAGAYGEGWLGYGGLVIAMDTVMAYNGGIGRLDTIAHELGHNLGLVPANIGGDTGGHSTVATDLMASGSIRLVPSSLSNIAPDGSGYDQLPTNQINLARTSSLLHDVPEPGVNALLVLGLAGLARVHRRAHNTRC